MRLTDIEVLDSDGNVVLSAEVKSRSNKDSEWAADYRRNLAAHGRPLGKYLLLVTRDDAYLWRNDEGIIDAPRRPDKVAPTRVLLGSKLGSHVGDESSSAALEHLVAAWLASLTHAGSVDEVSPGSRAFLVDSGLWEALRNTNVRVA